MELFADRFLIVDRKTAVDLATGQSVALTIAPAGDAREQGRWAVACDAAERRHHPAVPRLIDFGTVGSSHRFEARQPLVAGVTAAREGPAIVLVPRPAVTAIGELFDRPPDRRPSTVAIWGPRGAGKHTIVTDLARTARRHGFVPIAAPVLATFADGLRGRSLFVIDEAGGAVGWTAWLKAAIDGPRPHVLLVVSLEEPWTTDGVAVGPLPIDALVSAVELTAPTRRQLAAIERAAKESRGWPGRFARLLWRLPDRDRATSANLLALRAAEQPAVYGVEEPPSETAAGGAVDGDREQPAAGSWAPSSDSATWRRRAEAGERLARDGKHAAGERSLRQAVGALTRRRDWASAGQGGLALAELLLRRGRPRDAHDAVKAASEAWQRAGDATRVIDAAVVSGAAAIELARLDHAETILSAAVASARALGDAPRIARATRGLARTLFWAGRYDEADTALKAIAVSAADEREAIVSAGLAVAIAIGRGDVSEAVACATGKLAQAQRLAEPEQIAVLACRAAFAHLAVGDTGAVERDAALGIAAARRSRRPLLAARSRLVLAEALRRAGRQAPAAAIVARIGRFGLTRLPPIVRARWELVRELLTPARDQDEIVRRHVASTGLGALALYGLPRVNTGVDAGDPVLAGVAEILSLCQTSEDEPALLTEVCRRVRSRLHAVAAAVVAVHGQGRTTMATDGGRIEPMCAERAIAAGVTIAPARRGDQVEAAAPVRYGGTIIGAVAVRWTIGTPHDLGPAGSVVATVAVAVAPIVAAALARATRPPSPALAGLIGSSAAMAEVRRAIERAAAAPFAVLIEGESGTGKELVARALHRSGARRDRAFCTLNCAALPDDLIEAELFGHARGAFTGAAGERTGVFEEAHGGTLFLDEIGELSPRAQAKVLRVIQEGELRRVGENTCRRVDVRIVAATNRDLRQEVAAGRFRLDLLYRLDVVRIGVPPLRQRREDIPLLAEHFWREAAGRVGSRATLSAATLAALARYGWPGNVRELQNTMASLAVRSAKRGTVEPSALGPQFGDARLEEAMRLDDARRTFEERFVRAALVRAGGHRARAAAELGVTRQGLVKLMARLGINDGG